MKKRKQWSALLLCAVMLFALTVPVLAEADAPLPPQTNGPNVAFGWAESPGFYKSSFENYGLFNNSENAVFNNTGVFSNNGRVTNSGSFHNTGTLFTTDESWGGATATGTGTVSNSIMLTEIGANITDSGVSFYPDYIGVRSNSVSHKLEFINGSETLFTLTQDSGYFVLRESENYAKLKSATAIRAAALDLQTNTPLEDVAPITVPFSLSGSSETVTVSAQVTASDNEPATLLASLDNFKQTSDLPSLGLVLSAEGNDSRVSYSAWPNNDGLYETALYDPALVSAAKANKLTVTVDFWYAPSTSAKPDQTLSITDTHYTGSTTAVYNGTEEPSQSETGSNGYAIEFQENGPSLGFSLTVPDTPTADSYNVVFSGNGDEYSGKSGIKAGNEANYSIWFNEGYYTNVKVYAHEQDGSSGALLAEIPINLIVQTDSAVSAPESVSVKRETSQNSMGYYTYHVYGDSLNSSYEYLARIASGNAIFYANLYANLTGSWYFNSASYDFIHRDILTSVGICAQTWEKSGDSYIIKRSVPHNVTIDTLSDGGFSLAFDDAENHLTYTLTAPDATATTEPYLVEFISKKGAVFNNSAVPGISYEFMPIRLGENNTEDAIERAVITNNGSDDGSGGLQFEPLAEISFPALSIRQDASLAFPAEKITVTHSEIAGGADTFTVHGLTDASYAYQLKLNFPNGKLTFLPLATDSDSDATFSARSSLDSAKELQDCTITAYKVSGNAVDGYTVTWTKDLTDIPITHIIYDGDDGKFTRTTTRVKNADGGWTESVTRYQADDVIEYREIVYDANGKIISDSIKDANGILLNHTVHNSDGNRTITYYNYNENGSVNRIVEKVYAADGSLLSISVKDGSSKALYRYTPVAENSTLHCFTDDYTLLWLDFKPNDIKTIVIDASVTTINKSAFSACTSLTSVTIPASVTAIGIDAFNNCPLLSTVIYTGTADEWNKIKIASGNNALTDANIQYADSHSSSGSANTNVAVVLTCSESDKLVDNKLKLKAHDEVTLMAKLNDSSIIVNSQSWLSNNKDIATVSTDTGTTAGGEVTAVSAGNTVIQVTLSTSVGLISTTCAVEVYE